MGDSEPKSRCFKSDTKIVQDVYSQASREIWSVLSEDNTLQRDVLQSRVRMDRHGVTSYLHCTCVSKLCQGANGSFGVFQLKTTDTWHLCVIQSLFYLTHDDTDKVYLLEWTGVVDRMDMNYSSLPFSNNSLISIPFSFATDRVMCEYV